MKTQIDIIEIYQRILGKIIKAVENSDFALCSTLSSEMIRLFDHLDFTDGMFIGEFLESLFSNINSINTEYMIEQTVINNLKIDITNLISVLIDSYPMTNTKKIKIYDLIADIRAKISKLQLESFRGERKRKIIRRIQGEPLTGRLRLPGISEEIEIWINYNNLRRDIFWLRNLKFVSPLKNKI